MGLYALTRYTKNVKEAVEAGISVVTSMVGSVLLWLCGSIIPSSPVPQLGFYLLARQSRWRLDSEAGSSAEKMAVDSALVGLLLLLGRDGVTGVQNV